MPEVFGITLSLQTVLIGLTPFMTAAIGWFTNWLAIKMLFRPKKRIRLLFWSFQGLIPKRQNELAAQCAEIVEKELLQQHMLEEAISSIDIKPHIEKIVHRLIEEKLSRKLKEIPMLGAFITPETLSVIKDMAAKEMLGEGEQLLSDLSGEMAGKFDIRSIVEQKISEFDLDKLESIVMGVSKREFKTIERLGAVLGFFIGVVQVVFFYFSGQF